MMLRADSIADRLEGKEATPGGLPAKQADSLVIVPSPDVGKLRQRGVASIDLHLGTWFATLRQARMTHFEVGKDYSETRLTKTNYVRFSSEYVLHPRSFVLAVTLEWLRMPVDLGAYVIGKSSLGRCGLIIATATGVHPNFVGCLTLELSNVGELPIVIKPGMEICQLFFHKVQMGNSSGVDYSQFACTRKPVIRTIKLDEFAQRLTTAHESVEPGREPEELPVPNPGPQQAQ
jgi:dCTP deaminase